MLRPSQRFVGVAVLLVAQGKVLLTAQDAVPPAPIPGRLQTLVRDRRWSDALPLAEDAVRRRPRTGSAWYTLGLILHNQRQLVRAHRALRQAEQLLPDNADVHRLLGLNYYLLEQYRLFEEQMQKARALKPGEGEFDYWLGRYQQMVVGDHGRAIAFFNRAISLDPSNYRALYNRGDCYEQSGDPASAEKDYVAAIELIRANGTAESWPFQALAGVYLRTDRLNDALVMAKQAVAMDSSVYLNHLVLGKALAENGEIHNAIQELQRATELNPAAAGARYQLSRLYIKAGNREAAERELAAYREIVATYQATDSTR